MEIVSLADAPSFDPKKVVASVFLEGSECNIRVIRLSAGQALPPHTHGASDLMIYAVEGQGSLVNDGGTVALPAGSLAYLHGDEELRMSNDGNEGLTLLAFFAPAFPPRSKA